MNTVAFSGVCPNCGAECSEENLSAFITEADGNYEVTISCKKCGEIIYEDSLGEGESGGDGPGYAFDPDDFISEDLLG